MPSKYGGCCTYVEDDCHERRSPSGTASLLPMLVALEDVE